ncbi:MAG: hypothetical protein IKC59_03425 [Clostridia bacterium]|nr:hypothetical protein [Clostridia bacterium]
MNASRRHGLLSKFHIVLLCALLVFASFMTYTVGRYLSMAELTGEMVVAQFDVDAIGAADVTLNIDLSGGNETASTQYPFSVTSNSKVTVEYDVTVIMPDAVPAGLTLTIDGITPTVNGLAYRFASVGTIAAGDNSTHQHILTFVGTGNEIVDSLSYNGIQITVHAVQKD